MQLVLGLAVAVDPLPAAANRGRGLAQDLLEPLLGFVGVLVALDRDGEPAQQILLARLPSASAVEDRYRRAEHGGFGVIGRAPRDIEGTIDDMPEIVVRQLRLDDRL